MSEYGNEFENVRPAFPTGAVPSSRTKQETHLISAADSTIPVHPNAWKDHGIDPSLIKTAVDKRAHNHYFKNVSKLQYIDVYRVLSLFNVTDPCIQHAVKKLLVAGGRGAGKDVGKDIQESIDSLVRWQEMQKENV